MCLKKIEGAALGLAVIGLALFVSNALLITDSQSIQRQIAERQARINDGVKLAQLNNELVRALGNAVVQKKDTKIKDMLSEHGITVQEKAPANAAAPQ